MSDPKKILVVEDDPDEAAYLVTLLRDHGFHAFSAANGREGFLRAKAEHPDLITLDISMPEESGVRMLRDLQSDPDTSQIPVIIITGIVHDLKRFLETRKQLRPPQGYFDKPPDPDQLLARIRELVGIKEESAGA